MNLNRRNFLKSISAAVGGIVAASYGLPSSAVRHSPLPDSALPIGLELVEELWCEVDISGIAANPVSQRFSRIRTYYNIVRGQPVFTRTDWIEPSGKVVTIPIPPENHIPSIFNYKGGLC